MPIPERCCYNSLCNGFIKGSNLCEDTNISKTCCSEHIWRKAGYMRINETKWKTKNPKLFEYDSINKVVDLFVREDLECPFPFHEEDWYHQGYYLKSFIIYLNVFFERFKLPYKVNQLK